MFAVFRLRTANDFVYDTLGCFRIQFNDIGRPTTLLYKFLHRRSASQGEISRRLGPCQKVGKKVPGIPPSCTQSEAPGDRIIVQVVGYESSDGI